MMPPVRLGLIGLGHWGRVCAHTIAKLGELGCLSVLVSQAADAGDLGVPVLAHWHQLLAADLCDAVVIATPAHTHLDIAAAALECGLALFIEKPLCTDAVEAHAFRDLFQSKPVPLIVDHIHLFNPAFRQMVKLAQQLGPVLAIEAAAGKPMPAHPLLPILWDWGAHDVAMCLEVMGCMPDTIKAEIKNHPQFKDGIGEIVQLDLGFGGTNACLHLGSLPQRQRMMRVHCQGGELVYDDMRTDGQLMLDGIILPVVTAPPLQLALEEFCHRIMAGDCHGANLDRGVQVVEILSRAERGMRR